MLTRTGNKQRIAHKIIPHFPEHKTFIDMFFGAGGIFFNKCLVDYNICNDNDNEVYNLHKMIQKNFEIILEKIIQIPIHQTLFNEYKTADISKMSDIDRAIRFLFLSNFSQFGSTNSLLFSTSNEKKIIENNMKKLFEHISNVKFTCVDFRQLLAILRNRLKTNNTFIYADPPYLDTTAKYNKNWGENDSIDLFDILIRSNMKFAISEFDNPFILDLAKQANLEVVEIGERQNLKNRRVEILIKNY